MAVPAPVYHCSPRRCQTMLAAIFLVALGACARTGAEAPRLAAARVPVATPGAAPLEHVRFSETVTESDWTVLRRALATALVETEDGATVSWNNAETGSTGTVTPLMAARAGGGSLCRAFAATIDADGAGNRYRGEACRTGEGRWELLGVVPEATPL